MPELQSNSPVDVDAVMEEIRARVAESGSAADALFQPAPLGGLEIVAEPQLERAEDAAIIVPDFTVGRSTRAVIGPLVARFRGFVIRAGAGSVGSVAAQQTRFNAEVIGYSRALGLDLAQLRRQTSSDHVTADHLAAVDRRLDRLEGLLGALTEQVGAGKHSST